MDAGMTMSVMHFEMWCSFDRWTTVGVADVGGSVWMNLCLWSESCLNHCGGPSSGVAKRMWFSLTLLVFSASPQSCGLHSM